ncbi:MAG: hypothetical protein FWC09_01805 [Lachnospiraceae bacterium]|nr:hypothetical protein [Lachnospiraceae bacterium]
MKNQSMQNIKKEIKTASSLLICQQRMIEELIANNNNLSNVPKKDKYLQVNFNLFY